MRQVKLCLQSQPAETTRSLLPLDGLIKGKRTTKTVSKRVAEECARRIKNYRGLQTKIEQIVEDALANAPWNDE